MMLFVFFGCGAASSNLRKGIDYQAGFTAPEWDAASTLIISLQFGLAITVLAYATAHSSGGHINCAVTWALTLVGKCHPVRAACYFVAQCLGSVVGAFLLKMMTTGGDSSTGATALDRTGGLGANGFQNPSVTVQSALVAEVMGTFLLVLVVLETAVNSSSVTTEGAGKFGGGRFGGKQSLAPIAIGLAVFLAHAVLVPITGCSINPTRSLGPSIIAGSMDNHWVWWAGPLVGATLASLVWALMMSSPCDSSNASQPSTDSVAKTSVVPADNNVKSFKSSPTNMIYSDDDSSEESD